MRIQPTTEAELELAIKAGRRRRETERRASGVHYDRERDAIWVDLTDGVTVSLPRQMVVEFRDVPPADMGGLRVPPVGYGIKLDTHDINISVNGLIAALVKPAEMAASLGRLGGAVRSEKKVESARANGAKGGRPRKLSAAD